MNNEKLDAGLTSHLTQKLGFIEDETAFGLGIRKNSLGYYFDKYSYYETAQDALIALAKKLNSLGLFDSESERKESVKDDTQRMDFLERNPNQRLIKHKKHWSCTSGLREHTVYPTARKAIDAAMISECYTD